MKWLADENFPLASFDFLRLGGLDIKHIGIDWPSVLDINVIELAVSQNRIVLTFDSDFGTLIFKDGYSPLGVVYFRLVGHLPTAPANILLELIAGDYPFERYLTVISSSGIRQRIIPLL